MHETYIAEAINGVLMKQGNIDVKFIIADDFSPNNTKVVVESFTDHPNSVVSLYLFSNPRNAQ